MRTLIVLGILALATPSWAVSYCVDTNDRQESALTWLVTEHNADIDKQNVERAKKDPPEAALPQETNQNYVTKRVKDVLRDYVKQHAATTDAPLKADVEAATDAKKTKIRNVLNCDKLVCP